MDEFRLTQQELEEFNISKLEWAIWQANHDAIIASIRASTKEEKQRLIEDFATQEAQVRQDWAIIHAPELLELAQEARLIFSDLLRRWTAYNSITPVPVDEDEYQDYSEQTCAFCDAKWLLGVDIHGLDEPHTQECVIHRAQQYMAHVLLQPRKV